MGITLLSIVIAKCMRARRQLTFAQPCGTDKLAIAISKLTGIGQLDQQHWARPLGDSGRAGAEDPRPTPAEAPVCATNDQLELA